MNDPDLFRRRRVGRIVENEEARRAGSDAKAAEAAAQADLKALIVERLQARGAVEVAPGV